MGWLDGGGRMLVGEWMLMAGRRWAGELKGRRASEMPDKRSFPLKIDVDGRSQKCAHIRLYAYMTDKDGRTHTCKHICIHHTHTDTYTREHTHTPNYIRLHYITRTIYTYICTYARTRHTHTQIYTPTHTHISVHTLTTKRRVP